MRVYNKKIASAALFLVSLIVCLAILDYIQLNSEPIFIFVIILVSILLWLILRHINSFEQMLENYEIFFKTNLVILLSYIIGYLLSANILELILPKITCVVAPECSLLYCPLIFNFNDFCHSVQQFLLANIRFNMIQMFCLISGQLIATKFKKE